MSSIQSGDIPRCSWTTFRSTGGGAFDDQLIMDMSNDEAVPESFHGVAENVVHLGTMDGVKSIR